MSGGVDSSVAAFILKWQGYNVIGLFMKNWEEETTGGFCPSEVDFADVKRVAEIIGIPYFAVNFSKQYMDNVFKVFLDGLGRGVTPNPDILCNREIKFGPFLKKALEIGGEFVATGHYCRVREGKLLKGIDESKDQSYFLCGLGSKQLSKVMFPIGGLLKTQVREIAKEVGLAVAEKKDSTGICFVGERKFREFMKGYLGNQSGEIKTLDGKTVGRHEGLMYYTLGQRKGLGIGGSSEGADRWFVVRKDLQSNTLYVNNGECAEMFTQEVIAENFNWIGGKVLSGAFTAKTRYRQPDQKCVVSGNVKAVFEKPQRAVTPGQWLVLYDGDVCLGGGIIQ
jgi:tRNA-specific 2-thiouridylase